ncbi:LytTR family DNA-binding domain-containing protein, partial [Bacteroidota bacterium]
RDVYLIDNGTNKYIIDYNLEDLENTLDPILFQRVNRTYILNINAIKDVIKYSNSRLKVILKTDLNEEIIVSRDRVLQFKSWFDGFQ